MNAPPASEDTLARLRALLAKAEAAIEEGQALLDAIRPGVVEDNFEGVREFDAATRDDYPERAADVLAASIEAGTPVTVAADDEDDDDRPTAVLECGDQLATDEVVAGDPVTCPRHGETTVIGFIYDACGLPTFGDGVPCPLFEGHDPLPGCPGAGERVSLRIAGGAS